MSSDLNWNLLTAALPGASHQGGRYPLSIWPCRIRTAVVAQPLSIVIQTPAVPLGLRAGCFQEASTGGFGVLNLVKEKPAILLE
ncbi:hypothetical protein BREVUG8_110001 [Brevundimonas sp. G8]|nr:hypothetical protein BREVUG8_110001 [Brevundimonas sp. G8]